MAIEKILTCVGMNGMDLARLRLLVREAAPYLRAKWRWGDTGNADLLIVAPGSFESEAAVLRANGRGVRCIMLGDERAGEDNFLPRPFAIDDVIRILDAATPQSGEGLDIIDPDSPELFGGDDGGFARRDLPAQADLDDIFRRDPGADTLAQLVPHRLGEATTVEHGAEPTQRSLARDAEIDPYDLSDRPSGRTHADTDARDTRAFDLRKYLEGGLLAAPSLIELPGCAPLVLDPKLGQYHIEGDLEAARAYAGQDLRVGDFRRLTSTELEQVRAHAPAQPYVRLRWLGALMRSDGWLPRHLDPGGSYRLRQWLQLGPGFDAQQRISQSLLDWHRLHEVTSAAQTDMQTVFDTVAAYDAIGYVEWKPRERLRTP